MTKISITAAAIATEFVEQMNDDLVRGFSRDDAAQGVGNMLSVSPETEGLDLDEVLDHMEILIGARLWALLTEEAQGLHLETTDSEIVIAKNAGGGTVDALRYDSDTGEVWLAEGGESIPWDRISGHGQPPLTVQDILDARD